MRVENELGELKLAVGELNLQQNVRKYNFLDELENFQSLFTELDEFKLAVGELNLQWIMKNYNFLDKLDIFQSLFTGVGKSVSSYSQL